MIRLQDINQKVIFEPLKHTYHKDDKEFISVSTLISLYKPKFDEFGHIKRACAKRDGVTVQDIENKWKQTNYEGITRGKSFHRQAEHFIKTGEILKDDYEDVIKLFSKIKFQGTLYSEIGLSSDKFLLAGTADLIELFDNGECNLFDFKSNKKIDSKSKYGTKLLHPLEHLDDCEINNYSIQLNLYKLMLEEHGFKVKKIVLFHINPQTREIDTYKIPVIKKDIKKLLDHYTKMRDW